MLRRKSQIPECERERKLKREPASHTLGSCSDLHTLKNSRGSSAHTVLSYQSVFFHSKTGEKKGGKSLFGLQNHCLADLKLHFPWVCSSQSTSFCCLCYYFGRSTGPKYFEANKCFKNQSLPQGTLGKLYSEVILINQRQWTGGSMFPLGTGPTLAGILPCQLGRRHKKPGLHGIWEQPQV